ncbi:MAG: hypothetical protein ACOVOQ_04670 [Flavobacterium sp.]
MKVLPLLFVLSSCAGMYRPVLPIEKRTLEYTVTSNLRDENIFQNIKFWLPTQLKSNYQLIQAEDKSTGRISGNAFIPCNELPGSSITPQSIEFQYLISIKDKNISIKLSNQRIYMPDMVSDSKETNLFNDESQTSGTKICFDKLIKDMESAIK